jgi:hypothetical protein
MVKRNRYHFPPAQSHLLEAYVYAGGWKRVLFSFLFVLLALTQKDQSRTAVGTSRSKASAALAKCWPAATTAHRAHKNIYCGK